MESFALDILYKNFPDSKIFKNIMVLILVIQKVFCNFTFHICFMSKKEKLIARLVALPKNFTYDEMRTLLCSLGFEERSKGKTSGSRVEYVKGNDTILLHRPHPNNHLKPYQVKQIVEVLKSLKLI